MLESLLDQIPSLGEVRRKALLDRFGSVAAIRKATVEDIAQVPGIGPKSAQSILAVLSPEPALTVDLGTGEILG